MHKQFQYTVNDEPQHTDQHKLAPRTILDDAGFNPESHYLMLIRGHERISFKDNPTDPIHMHQHMKFLAISCEPTPVS